MPLPPPGLGLVVHYGFVWAGLGRSRPPDAGQDRPGLIVDLERVEEPELPGRSAVRVTYLPILHCDPAPGGAALGLTAQKSYIYTSYAGEDDWPFDVARVPGANDRFDYGIVPPRLFDIVARDFRAYLAMRPDFPHIR